MNQGRSRARAPNGRLLAYGGGAGLVALTFLMLLAPATLGGVATHVIVLSAPYKGVATGHSSSWGQAGCGGAKVVVPPFFHAKTGLGGFKVRAGAPTCNNPAGSSGSSSAAFTNDIPVAVPGGNHTIVTLFTINAVVASHITPATCTKGAGSALFVSCYQFAYASLYGGYEYLYDQNTGAYWYSNYWYGVSNWSSNSQYYYNGTWYNYTNGPGGTITVSATFAWWINASALNPADHYFLVMSFSGYASAYQSSYGATATGGTTWAVVNLATAGNGMDLASITIT